MPGIAIISPKDGSTVSAGNVAVAVEVTNNSSVSGYHLIYYKDVMPPEDPAKPAITAEGSYAITNAASYVWQNIPNGSHIFAVQMVRNELTPLEPPVAAVVSVIAVSENPSTWTPVPIPSTNGNVIGPKGIDILDIAVAGDGTTIYVAARSFASSKLLYKSTDSGASWSDLSQSSGLSITETDLVAVAPDNAGIVVVADKTAPATYVTIDGGNSWASLGTISGSSGSAAIIYDIGISALKSGVRYVGVASTLNPGDHNSPALFYLNLGEAVPRWRDAVHDFSAQGGANLNIHEIDAIRAVEFSPSFPSDLTATVVSEQVGTASKAGAVRFHMVSFASHRWDSQAGFTDYPVTIANSSNIVFNVGHVSISLSPDYQASDDSQRIAFVGMQVTDSTHNRESGGIYRLNDTSFVKILDAPIYSVAFDGTNLVAGATTDGAGVASHVVYYCSNPVSGSPTVKVTSNLKRPGGTTAVIVAWAGDMVVAGTSGANSAFSISKNKGQSFNDISLIDMN